MAFENATTIVRASVPVIEFLSSRTCKWLQVLNDSELVVKELATRNQKTTNAIPMIHK